MHLYQLFSWFKNEMKRVINVSKKSRKNKRKKKFKNLKKKIVVVSSIVFIIVKTNKNKIKIWISKKYLTIFDNFFIVFNVLVILLKNFNINKHLNFSFECAKTN